MDILGNKNGTQKVHTYFCELCDYKCSTTRNFEKHKSTQKHKWNCLGIKSGTQNVPNYVCEYCHYSCSRNSHWKRHIVTDKHLEMQSTEKVPEQNTCECGKNYKTKSGLWKHNKICKNNKEEKEQKLYTDDTIVWNLVKQNQEFKEMMIEQQKYMMELAQKTNVVNNNNNITNNNTQNNQFNLQFFLNETCKDAMNINQFIDSIHIKLEDLEYTGKNGFIQGVSKVIVRELKSLDQKDRPLHCSEEKREVFYIKTNDVWEKDINHAGVTRFTKHITHKKFVKMNEWIAKHPTCLAHDDKKNDEYLSILGQIVTGINAMNDADKPESMKKIIRVLAKQTTIQKDQGVVL